MHDSTQMRDFMRMRKRNMTNQRLVALAAALLVTGRLSADVISQSGEVSDAVPTSLDIVVKQFNDDPNHDGMAEYRLTSVTLQVVGHQDAVLDLGNNSSPPSTRNWTVNLNQGSITLGNDTLQASAAPGYSQRLSVAPGTTQITPSTGSASDEETFTTGLSAFIGDGSVNNMTVAFDGSWGATGMRGGDGISIVSYTGTADWTVTYEYANLAAVPEPGTLALMGFGGVVLILCSCWRRRAKP